MKTIGLIGGTSWVSTAEYYRIINEETNKRLGGHNFARCAMFSVNMAEILELGKDNNWDGIADLMTGIAKNLQHSDAACLLLCANTLHKVADKLEENINIPLLHIAVEVGKVIRNRGLMKVGLLGTKFTMEQDFYSTKLNDFNIDVVVPEISDRDFLHNVIYSELSKGIFENETKNRFLKIIGNLQNNGAEGIILGCTEIPMLISQADCDLPLFDTTFIHAAAAVEFAVGR